MKDDNRDRQQLLTEPALPRQDQAGVKDLSVIAPADEKLPLTAMTGTAAGRQAEKTCLESERIFRAVADYTPDWESWIGTDGKLIWVNPSVFKLTGYSVEECMQMDDYPAPMVHEEDRKRAVPGFIPDLHGPSLANVAFRILHRDGSVKWAEVCWQPIYDDNGVSLGHRASIRDINERRQAEERLRKSEMRNRRLFENSLTAICIVDKESLQYLDANDTHIRLYGYTREELLGGMNVADLSAEPEASLRAIWQVLSSSDPSYVGERLHRKKDGTLFPVEIRAELYDLEGAQAFCVFVNDITERKRIKNGLIKARDELEDKVIERTRKLEAINQAFMRELKERNRLEAIWKKAEFITNSSREMMTLINRHYVFEAANNAYCSAQGKSRDEIIGKTAAEIWGEQKFSSVIKPKIDRCLRGELVENEDWIDFPQLGPRYFTITYCPYSQAEGRVTHVSVITHDITERKKAEDALKIHERDLRLYAKELEEANTALRVFFKQHSDDQKKMEEKLQLNVNELVMPYIEKLRQQNMGKQYLTYLELLELNLQNIVSPFMKNLSAAYQNLTPQEIQIAEMIRQGKSSQEMAAVLNLSVRTVNTHRNNMRKKLKLTNRTMKLRSYLLAFS